LYFKAADVLALPYKQVFQSGLLFLASSFGLPVIATDVGSFAEEIIDCRTGFLCEPCDTGDLVRAVKTYFTSDLYKYLDDRRQDIFDVASERHSWHAVGEMTATVYRDLLGR
jgi:glycosyltransferase involved in cell wall biosynthesis